MPLAALAGIGAIGSIGSALIGSNSAKNAANQQYNAANQAAQYTQGASNNALNFENGIWNQTQQNYAPYQQFGAGSLGQLGYLLGINPYGGVGQPTAPAQGLPTPSTNPTKPVSNLATATPSGAGIASGLQLAGSPSMPQSGAMGAVPGMGGLSIPQSGAVGAVPSAGSIASGLSASPSGAPSGGFGSLAQGYGQTFQAPTGLTEQNDPGYQARLNLGTDAIQRSAAARGNVLTGGTAKALDTYAQDYASNEYNNVYNRALQGFNTNYGVWNNDNNNIFSRLAALTGTGLNATNSLSAAGQNASNNITSNLLGSAGQIGNYYTNAGQAKASGAYNSGAAWGGALGGIGGNLAQLYQLNQLQNLNGTLGQMNSINSDGYGLV